MAPMARPTWTPGRAGPYDTHGDLPWKADFRHGEVDGRTRVIPNKDEIEPKRIGHDGMTLPTKAKFLESVQEL